MPIQRTVALCLLWLGLLFGGPGSRAAEPAAATDWGTTLERDARAFHAALAARHPGPVDPENPGFGAQLDAALARALERVPATRDYGGRRSTTGTCRWCSSRRHPGCLRAGRDS